MNIAVQLRPWLIQEPPPPLETVLDEVVQAGFEGIEIGAHYLDWNRPAALRAALDSRRLRLAGVHVGGDIFNLPNVLRVRGHIEQVADCAAALNTSLLLYSGLLIERKTPAELQSELEQVTRAAEVCAARGLRLCYHNHWWEIANDFADLRFLQANTDPARVSFCVDLGWVQRAGGSPLLAVEQFGGRARSFHLRDDTPEQVWKGLGEGVMDLPPLLTKAASCRPDWFVIEQDDITGSVMQAVGASRAYLTHTMGW